MSHETNIILKRVVLVKVEANIYGARKKLKKEDPGLRGQGDRQLCY